MDKNGAQNQRFLISLVLLFAILTAVIFMYALVRNIQIRDESVSLPQGYSLKNHSIEKVLEISCVKNADCETPGEYAIRSNCPYTSICLSQKCTVVCPQFQSLEE